VLVGACGRLSFDGVGSAGSPDDAVLPDVGAAMPAPSVVDFCTTAAATIPGTATESFCVDFQDQLPRALAGEADLVPNHLHARANDGFSVVSVAQSGRNLAFRYQPAPSAVCVDSDGMAACCYSDLLVDYMSSNFTGQVHFEYDHYIVDAPDDAWVGSVFWGSRSTPYKRGIVDPPLDLGRWQHVAIDAFIGTDQPLNVTVDGVGRPNGAGQDTHGGGIAGSVGTFCWGDPGAGYIDNLLFYAF
jgi:hypothetical protein